MSRAEKELGPSLFAFVVVAFTIIFVRRFCCRRWCSLILAIPAIIDTNDFIGAKETQDSLSNFIYLSYFRENHRLFFPIRSFAHSFQIHLDLLKCRLLVLTTPRLQNPVNRFLRSSLFHLFSLILIQSRTF